VNTWATVFLGIIAMATLVTAILQVVVLVAAAQLVKRVGRFIDIVEQDVRPIIASVSNIARDASRVASLAAAQVERADQMLSSTVRRLEDLLTHVQTLVTNTMREGNALMMGVRAVMAIIRAFQGRRRRRGEDDEALFI
jgi:predicted PurR-regulated permease PerM